MKTIKTHTHTHTLRETHTHTNPTYYIVHIEIGTKQRSTTYLYQKEFDLYSSMTKFNTNSYLTLTLTLVLTHTANLTISHLLMYRGTGHTLAKYFISARIRVRFCHLVTNSILINYVKPVRVSLH